MTPELKLAYAKFREAQDELFDLLFAEAKLTPAVVRAAAPAPTAARVPARVTSPTLPKPLIPAKPGTGLSDKVRQENLPAATAVALRILKVIGDTNTLVPGVTGQLAIERIPYDATLVKQAIEAARGQV